MTTTEKKPRVKSPQAEIVGSFKNVMKRGKCTDGRSVFSFRYVVGYFDVGIESSAEICVLAGTKLQAWNVMHEKLGVMEKLTQDKISERYQQEALKLMEEKDSEPQKTADDK